MIGANLLGAAEIRFGGVEIAKTAKDAGVESQPVGADVGGRFRGQLADALKETPGGQRAAAILQGASVVVARLRVRAILRQANRCMR